MLSWINENETLIWSLTVVSAITFVATMVAIPILIVRLPRDYFVRRPVQDWPARHRWLHILLVCGKNILGLVLLIAALAMLVLPGQGLLTLLIGIMLLDFPGKRRLEGWLIKRKSINGAANWIRAKRGRPPLQLPEDRPLRGTADHISA